MDGGDRGPRPAVPGVLAVGPRGLGERRPGGGPRPARVTRRPPGRRGRRGQRGMRFQTSGGMLSRTGAGRAFRSPSRRSWAGMNPVSAAGSSQTG
ncbi:hypothetical protein CXF35_06335 [Corynebacterium bovis]|uniref:Uncharacterized protein n=1 Tax=Corynebacterium bovis TaxID=36808 RepID=A0A3R8PFI4_9CORY|nr:hypothetical protein CXF38_01595 [Corynebacterium bovis]RRO90206.1 hypothetical protein CXF45_06240 [Corynebacterium bovis]RRO92318.1 hypothetical protein CXF40_04135 [Corynebacterium bovis]RRO94989.1 hypothetical protein CXF29_06020 [Corynebacterium bovis]RRO97186.1 hypothetical protein CXF32_04835 [Corynebacterium bovis]